MLTSQLSSVVAKRRDDVVQPVKMVLANSKHNRLPNETFK